LDEEDWERAEMYAKLVRSFVINNKKSPKIEKSTYHQIQASRKSLTLFPNLREIYCDGRWEEVCLLLSPSLRRVVIREDKFLSPSSPAIFTFINALPKICPDIQSLEAYVDLPSSALRSVQKLQKLQYLGLEFDRQVSQSSNIEHMTGISLLPNLRLLKLSRAIWSDSALQKSLPTFDSPKAFSALQQLDIYASLESIANWLPSFISPKLTTFTAEIEVTWTDGDDDHEIPAKQLCYQLCDTLVKMRELRRAPCGRCYLLGSPPKFCPQKSKHSNRSWDYTDWKFWYSISLYLASTTKPSLNGRMHGQISKTFKVRSHGDSITMSGVITLLQLCRDLKNLALAFNATKLDLIPEIPPTPSLRHGLKHWDISGSLVTPDTLGPVIAVLSWVFLDMWDVKCRSQVAGEAASEVLFLSNEWPMLLTMF
jgi:hypothetical protein